MHAKQKEIHEMQSVDVKSADISKGMMPHRQYHQHHVKFKMIASSFDRHVADAKMEKVRFFTSTVAEGSSGSEANIPL